MSLPLPPSRPGRLVFLDALRGIACLLVLGFHLIHIGALQPVLARHLSIFFIEFTRYGLYGVQIFFVLSGFVIAHSLRATPINVSSVGRFIVRRQLRLDPPYWAMMAFCLLLWWLETQLFGPPRFSHPSWRAFIVNAFYLQNILGAEQVLGVAWTLCLEIQFYLFFIALLALIAWRGKELAPTSVSLALVWITGVASISLGILASMPVYFFGYWYMFAGGVLGCWALQSSGARRALLSYVVALSLCTLWCWFSNDLRFAQAIPSMVFAILIIVGIWRVGERGELETRVVSPVIQYFGSISYSLYLIHLPIMILIARIGFNTTGDSIWGAAAWLLLSAALCIGAAQLFFVWVERPSMAWAKSFKRRANASRP